MIIHCNALQCLLGLLTANLKKSIKKEACWTISNITAGNKDQIQAIIEAGIIPPLINLLGTAEFDIKKEAAWAISNATSGGSHAQIRFLVEQARNPPASRPPGLPVGACAPRGRPLRRRPPPPRRGASRRCATC